MAGIYATYYLVDSRISEEVNVPSNSFGFSDASSETRQLNDISQYQAISADPLFDADREPAKKVVIKKVVQKKVEKQLKVQAIGIAVTGENLLAVVRNLRTGKIARLRVNEEIDGWTLNSVSADSFVFAKGENKKVVKFKANGE